MAGPKIFIGMSGGVDSSVAALLLKRRGYDVTGVFMKNWEETGDDGLCTATQDFEDVRAVCEKIDIPYYTVNFAKQYWDRVFSYFLDEYRAGRTPNPDVLCNKEVKFACFLDFALASGADVLATGHFAQLEKTNDGVLLKKARDLGKDQTYFLSLLGQKQLAPAMFPIGGLTKNDVRLMAQDYGLANAHKKDSTGVCFIGERNFKSFLQNYLPAQPGPMCDMDGKRVGTHDGLMFYTLGQRRGLGLGGAGESWFVIKKDIPNNVLYVSRGEHPALFTKHLTGTDASWVLGAPPAAEFACCAKVRYRQDDQPCRVRVMGNCVEVEFDVPQRAVTPGQYVVFYEGDICLGAAVIADTQL